MTVVVKADRMIDGNGGPPVDDAIIHVDDGRIVFAGAARDAPPVDQVTAAYDLAGASVLPGLIDCHAHPVPFPRAPEVAATPWALHLQVLTAVDNVEAALRSGITTLRDCGAPHMTAFALREALATGLLTGPRLMIAGPPLCPTGGHGHFGGGECDGADGVLRKTRELFKHGVDFIKVTATGGGTPGTLRHRGTFSIEELGAAVAETQRHDSYVTAHCHATEGIRQCLDAGVPMLEHATFVDLDGTERFDPDVGARIADTGTIVVPTVEVHARWLRDHEGSAAELTEDDLAVLRRRQQSSKRRLEIVHELHARGVTLLIGSDAGLGRDYPAPFDDLALEIQLHVEAGVAPVDAIRAATASAADALAIADETGRLAPGLAADIVGVSGNPLDDVKVLGEPCFVMRAGTAVRTPPAISTPG